MLNLRMTLNDDVEIPNGHILDSLTFETSMTSEDFTIGDFLFTTVKTKFLNDTVINYGDIIKIYIIDEDKGIVYPYGIYMPYDIKKNQFAREIEFYPELIIKLKSFNTNSPLTYEKYTFSKLISFTSKSSGKTIIPSSISSSVSIISKTRSAAAKLVSI